MYPDRPVTFALIYWAAEGGGERTRGRRGHGGCPGTCTWVRHGLFGPSQGWTRPPLTLRIILRVEPRLGVIGFSSNGSASSYVSTLPPSSDGRASAASAAACGSFVMGAGGLVSAIVWPGAQRVWQPQA